MAFTRETVISDILAYMGNEFVPVELGTNAQDIIIDRTLDMFSRYKPLSRKEAYTVSVSGINEHECEDDVEGVKNIDIIQLALTSAVGGMAIETQMLAGRPVFYSTTDNYYDIAYYNLRRQWIATVQRVLASDPDSAIVIDPEDNSVKVYTYATSPLLVTLDTIIPHKADLTSIPTHSRRWVFDFALTEAQIIIGQTRSKFDAIPVAGTKIRLNGADLIANATRRQQELINEIQSMRADLFPRWS